MFEFKTIVTGHTQLCFYILTTAIHSHNTVTEGWRTVDRNLRLSINVAFAANGLIEFAFDYTQ